MSWDSDQQCLFDFESKDIKKNKFQVKKSGFILKSKSNEIHFSEMPLNEQNLISIDHTTGGYTLQNDSMGDASLEGITDKSIWIIVKSIRLEDQEKGMYELSIGDYLKIGRVRFRVRKLSPTGDPPTLENEEDKYVTYSSQNGIRMGNDIQCRVCLSECYTEENPFLSPCKCTGSVQYIHLWCLKQWLQSKMVLKKNEHLTEYQWKNLSCELCKEPFQSCVKQNGKEYSTISIKNPTIPYILLDKLHKATNGSHTSLAIQFQTTPTDPSKKPTFKNTLRIGRGIDSDVRINDISVSRDHAQVILKGNKFYLKDRDSKFGTLALIRNPIEFSDLWNNVSIQISQTVLELSLKKPSSLFSCSQQQPDHDEQFPLPIPHPVQAMQNQNFDVSNNQKRY